MLLKNGLLFTQQAVFYLENFKISHMETIIPTMKNKIQLKQIVKKQLADTLTPVSIYLRIRDHFATTCLLESTDFKSRENCNSIICMDPIANFKVENFHLSTTLPNGETTQTQISPNQNVADLFSQFIHQFQTENESNLINGFFGHTSFDAVKYFDTIQFPEEKRKTELPDINYSLFRFVIMIDHYKDELFIIENVIAGQESNIEKVETLIQRSGNPKYDFKLQGTTTSNLTDHEFKEMVTKAKHHCQIGDVFQLVLSRRYQQTFSGDDFNVYRILRSINPSPYLFYFDYGSYRIFGSSPEAQLVVDDKVATINPIAGTYKRTGDDSADQKNAQLLTKDPKENAEHIMLVDLARNDLSIHAKNVRVTELKSLQFFSHVIHLVSKVQGDLANHTNVMQVFGDTFPAGTLSGAPKYKAIELINKYENINRAFYGGAIGFIGFNGNMNQAIVIRSFLSKDNVLSFQAGAGIVVSSNEEHELQEVKNKLGALTKALVEAENV